MSNADIRCERPTSSGKPCRQKTTRFEPICKTHATENDRRLMQGIRNAFEDGLRLGEQSIEWSKQREVSRLVAEELAKRGPCKHVRMQDADGNQIVTVRLGGSSTYAYRWTGADRLMVGDEVLVPPGYWMGAGSPMQRAVVVEMGSDYDGPISKISQRAEAAIA